jgi:hypothetical protein
MPQIIWRRRVKTMLQYLISGEEKNFVLSDDHLATHYTFESVTPLLVVRNTLDKDVNDEKGPGKFIHMNRPFITS